MTSDANEFAQRGRQLQLFYPWSLVTPGTVFAHARRTETRRRLSDALSRIETDDVDQWRRELYSQGLALCGDAWDYLDNVCVAHSFAELARPRRILEIGVRRGLCTAGFASAAPDADLLLVDMWLENYGHRPNPGPDAIRPLLSAVAHRGNVRFLSGSSHQVLPPLFAANPGLMFDLILVDGDHTEPGAMQDLKNVLPHLELGGMLVFDDLAHPAHDYLYGLWHRVLNELGLRVRSAEYRDHGHGVGILIRAY